MSAAELSLSAELRRIGEALPAADAAERRRIAQVLAKMADLARAQELELKLLRDMEAGQELRVATRQAIDAAVAGPSHGNVVFNSFRRKQ